MTKAKRIFFLPFCLFILLACSPVSPSPPVPSVTSNRSNHSPSPDVALARSKINHSVVIMQENRSFDTYFGTDTAADGLPRQNGMFTVCINDSQSGICVYPFHNASDRNLGRPHGRKSLNPEVIIGVLQKE